MANITTINISGNDDDATQKIIALARVLANQANDIFCNYPSTQYNGLYVYYTPQPATNPSQIVVAIDPPESGDWQLLMRLSANRTTDQATREITDQLRRAPILHE